MGRTLGFTYHEAETPLELAVSMAFNYQRPSTALPHTDSGPK